MVLNVRPEKSECVPSCEKWCCHHVGSWLVRTETRTPMGSESTAILPMRCAMRLCSTAVVARGAASGPGGSASSVTTPVEERGVVPAGRWVTARGRAMEAVNTGAGGGEAGPLAASERVAEDIRLTIGSVRRAPMPDIPQ